MRRSGPSRRVIAAVIAVAAALGGVLALLEGSGGSSLPQGGSRFAASSKAGGETLFDALAPLLAADRTPSGPAELSLGRAVAQLIILGVDGSQPTESLVAPFRAHSWGGVVLGRANFSSPAGVAQLVAAIRGAAATPPLVLARQAGGDSNAFPGLAPDSEPALGAIGRADLVDGQAQLAARQLRSLGIQGTLAPTGDIGDPAGPAAGRAYGSEAALVSRLTAAAVTGYRTGGLIAVVGHFPGEGAASQDPAQGTATVGLSLPDLEARDMAPFGAVTASAPVIEMSDAIFAAVDPVTPATLSAPAVDLLRGRLAYRGVVMSGDLGAATLATGGTIGDAAVASLHAGCDLLYVPSGPADALAAYGAVIDAVRQGRLDAATIARAYARVLALRRAFRAG